MSSARPWRRPALALGLAASLLAGCTVGPDYKTPKPPTPASDNFAAAAPAASSVDQPPDDWWRLYNVPVLDQLVQTALVHNKSLLAAAANLAYARAALSLARAGQYPSTQLSAGAQYGVSANEIIVDKLLAQGAPKPEPLYTAGLDVSYEVDLFGRVRRTIQAARADVQAQEDAEDVTRISVAGETTRAYVNACAYAEEVAVARQAVSLTSQTYQITLNEARDGTASDFDVARAHEAVSEAEAAVPTYEGERRTALFQLAVLTGEPPEQISQAADACASPPKLNTVLPIGDVQGLFRRRPDVRQAERQLAGNTARIGVATADLYPTISIGASVATAATSLAGIASPGNLTYGIGPLLNWAFPNTLVAQAEVREARASASVSYANFQAAVLQALQDTEVALTTYANELERNKALTEARGQSLKAFNLAKVQLQLGRVSYLDLLTAQSDLNTVSANLAISDQALASDQVTLFKALGGGWEQAPAVTALPITDARTGLSTPVR